MEIDIDRLHHAYLLEGAQIEGQTFLSALLARLNISKDQNPDYHLFGNEAFTIAEARSLTERAQNKAFGLKKIFVIQSPRYTPEAQNALLKTFEEPATDTHFFLLLPERDLLLPTLLSRLEIIRLSGASEKINKDAEEFLALSPIERIKFTKRFIDREKPLAPFLDSLLDVLKENSAPLIDLEKVFIQRRFADDPAVMPRLILEHLALVLK